MEPAEHTLHNFRILNHIFLAIGVISFTANGMFMFTPYDRLLWKVTAVITILIFMEFLCVYKSSARGWVHEYVMVFTSFQIFVSILIPYWFRQRRSIKKGIVVKVA